MTISIEEVIDKCKEMGVEPKTIFEIGAHTALDSCKMKKSFPLSEVYAFEAHPECYSAAKDAALKEGIKYYNMGMWNEETEILFYDKGTANPGISSFRDRGTEYEGTTFKLKTTTVENFCLLNKVDFIDVVKLDVEGCSYEVLGGFGDLLRTVKIIHVETEQTQHFTGQYTEEKVFELLEKAGFKKIKHSHCCLTQYDSMWVSGVLEEEA